MRVPRWLRRLVIWPLPVILVWIYLASVPLLAIAAFVVSYRLPGKQRALRALGLATVYAFVEVAIILATLVLWIGSGFGYRLHSDAFVAAHYRLLGWALRTLVAGGRRLFALGIDAQQLDVDRPTEAPSLAGHPLIVLSRHAGPADSILVMHELVDRFHRRPRIVLKDTLQWDPAFDILLNRLPTEFVRHGADRRATVDALGRLAGSMGATDAFVIFPEGGNFTEHRRRRSIRFFEERGRHVEAKRARALRHVLPPRPDGALAALEACPDADVVVVAHTGLDEIGGVRDLWRSIPDHKELEMVFAVVPADAIPPGSEARTEWLWSAWERVDDWVSSRRTAEGPAD